MRAIDTLSLDDVATLRCLRCFHYLLPLLMPLPYATLIFDAAHTLLPLPAAAAIRYAC